MRTTLLPTLLAAAAILPLTAHADPITKINKQPTALLLTTATSTLRIEVFSPTTLHITAANTQTLPPTKSFSVIASPDPNTQWTLEESPDTLTLKTAALHARINRSTAAITFLDTHDNPLLAESDNGRSFAPPAPTTAPATAPTTLPAIPLGHLAQSFRLAPNEALFGLGQHQQGLMNYRGHGLRLLQENTDIAIPVALSSKAYVLFWDNPAVTDVAAGASAPAPAMVKGTPPIEPAGPDTLRFSSETTSDKTPINYYFCYDGSPDASMRAYRYLTGDAPLLPEYALGFWHCKERFRSQDELLAAAREFRDRHIPIDGIIQDWRYWVDDTWGSHVFDKSRYPDPAAMFKTLHDEHLHSLISVWPKFDLNTETHDQLQAAGALYPPVIPYVFPPGKGQWYDPFNPAGRDLYWKQVASHLFSLGVDGWWLDAPEPELSGKWGEFRNFTTAAGPGADVFNAYPLMHSTGIYQGQRAQTDAQRVVILTRSAYAGQQRNAAISWSGDIRSSWDVFKKQVPAGLNFAASGIPYWNTDIGGFFNDGSTGNMNPQDPRYQELFTRWFQFGAFCPMFRVHGSAPNGGAGPGKELWRFGDQALPRLLTVLNLRYRLLPYLYSTSWQVTSNGYTLMRPLVMDFPTDPAALNIPDQYLFGPSILVCPVTTQGATSRSVYLPKTSPTANETWVDFWTNESHPAGTTLTAPAPLDKLPLYIRAGTILPLGPLVQYAAEKPDAPIELRIYPGADAHFTLYEDDTTTYNYEKGQHTTIPLTWNDTTHTLTIGQREGTFPTMPKSHTFHITLATPHHAAGPDPATPDKTVTYTGQQITLTP
jgi:alpha-D-xyloside xylohydrolase